MVPAILTDDERSSLVNASRNVLLEALKRFKDYDSRVGSAGYADESPAAEFQEATSRCKGPDGFWLDDLGRRLTDQVNVYFVGSRNYLGSMYALVEGYSTGPGLASIARCIGEASGKIAWLLDNRLGPVSHARERVARLLLDELDDTNRRRLIAGGLGHPNRAEMSREHRASRDAVAKPGRFWAGEIDIQKSGEVSLRAQRLPTPSRLFEMAEEVLHPGENLARHVYGYLSAASHPTRFAYLEGIAGGSDEVFCAKLANFAVRSFHDEMRMHSGWTQKRGEALPEGDLLATSHNDLSELINELGP